MYLLWVEGTRTVPDVYYSIHRVPANTNGDSYQSTYTVQVRRAYSSLRYSRHRPIRFDSDRVDVIRGDVKRDRQRARDQHEWAPWRYTDGPSTRAFEGPFEAVGLAGRCLGADHFAHRVRHISAPFGRFHFSISLLPTLPSHQRHPYGRICLCVECMSLYMHILLTYMYCVVVDRCGGP